MPTISMPDPIQIGNADDQKLEAFGQLAGGIAHDFNNLLTIIHGFAELLLQSPGSSENGASELKAIVEATERGVGLTRQLLAFARKQTLYPRPLNLNESVASVGSMLRRHLGEHIQLATCLEPELRLVEADPVQIEQVLTNLLISARDAMPQGGEITISTANVTVHADAGGLQRDVPAGDYAVVAVKDTGHGMDEATAGRIFEPFFTTKQQGKGTSLGLATVYGIVRQSGGYIRVASKPGAGTTFWVCLPHVKGIAAGDVAPTQKATSDRGDKTILLVEDATCGRPFPQVDSGASLVLVQDSA